MKNSINLYFNLQLIKLKVLWVADSLMYKENKMNLKERAAQLKTDIPAIFIALSHKRTPWYAKITAILTVVYALSPIDLIPDFIPVLGYLDDVLILPAFIALTIKLVPPEVMKECKEKAKDLWKDGKPKGWKYAVPIIAIWILIIALVIKALI